ncbi:hypothetical protein PVAP13_4KG171700 [Panicum virgatum]|uniref:Ubiquitin-like domain-containing protein n=1 Tax=Panicum virgatum TaxID=38727 RepID=A0A8T0TPB9_PANVG|nr:hypothetical protein PVAP13_4KG171700 [Panicum virgatum]
MAGGKEPIEVKFRLFDGTDIGPSKYDPSTTVAALKEFVLARWPQDKEIVPKTVNDVKLINAGRILENSKTLAESRVPVGEVPGSVITMHVVVRPPQSNKSGHDIVSALYTSVGSLVKYTACKAFKSLCNLRLKHSIESSSFFS